MPSKDVKEACDLLDGIVDKLQPVGVEVGWFSGKQYPDGLEVAENAIIQNYGAPKAGIPARPFFDNCIKENEDKWTKRFVELVSNGMSSEQALNIIGEMIKTDLQNSITNGKWEPNAPSTVKRKKSSKPLIDTGTMLGSIHKQIIKGGKK